MHELKRKQENLNQYLGKICPLLKTKEQATISSKGGQLARLKSLNYALIFPENILLTLFFMSMNTIFTYFRICENSYK